MNFSISHSCPHRNQCNESQASDAIRVNDSDFVSSSLVFGSGAHACTISFDTSTKMETCPVEVGTIYFPTIALQLFSSRTRERSREICAETSRTLLPAYVHLQALQSSISARHHETWLSQGHRSDQVSLMFKSSCYLRSSQHLHGPEVDVGGHTE